MHGYPVVDCLVPPGRVCLEVHALQGDLEVLADKRLGMEEKRRIEDAHDRDDEDEEE